MESLYEKYENIILCLTEFRNYKIDTPLLEYNDFKNKIQIEQLVSNSFIKPDNKKVYFYLFKPDSKYIKMTINFKKLIDKLPKENIDLIMVTKIPLSIYITKALSTYKNIKAFNYMHKHFIMRIYEGPLCSKHTVLTDEELKILCAKELIIHPLSLPAISINDPQAIWIGAEIGNVIKIESISEITGFAIRFRIVTPDSGIKIDSV